MTSSEYSKSGFTLIELSIVLIIIGLIVGGILVGRDLVSAAENRAQIAQIEKFNSAVNTFRGKFSYLPGDLPVAAANQFGFVQGTGCNGFNGARDGNGLIDGWGAFPFVQAAGETELFWQDISSTTAGNLIDGQYPSPGAPSFNCGSNGSAAVSGSGVGFIIPPAKLGRGNYMYVYEYNGANWFALSAVTATSTGGNLSSNTSVPVSYAYKIDQKIDDGLPTSGTVQTLYLNNNVNNGTTTPIPAPNTTTSGGSSTSCYDTTTNTYSISYNKGAGANCALSFKFQ